jgi:HEAT repeat protein
VALATVLASGEVQAEDDPKIGSRKVSEWFQYLRVEPDARRRMAALNLIDSKAGPKVAIVFPGLAKELREHADADIRAHIAVLLPKYKERGEEVVTALKAALTGDKEPKVRAAAATAVTKLDRPLGYTALKELIDALKDSSPVVRAAAAEALAQFSRSDPEVAKDHVPALAECLKDKDASVRIQSAYVLGRMGSTAAPAVPGLTSALSAEKDPSVRKEFVKALSAIGPKAAESAPALLLALHDSNAEVRQSAAIALGRVGPDAAAVLPDLLRAAHDPDQSVRCLAIHAIGSLGKPAASAVPELIEILKKDGAADVRLAAIEELAGFGADARSAVDALTVASKDGRPAIREAALEALKKIRQSP